MSASQHRLYFLFQRVAHRLKTEADGALKESGGLTTAQAAAMRIIAVEGPVTQRYIAEKLSQRESAITAMASRLLKAGYITKVKSSTDARAWELQATNIGREALNRMRQPFAQINAVLDDCFAEEEMEILADRMKTLLTRLER